MLFVLFLLGLDGELASFYHPPHFERRRKVVSGERATAGSPKLWPCRRRVAIVRVSPVLQFARLAHFDPPRGVQGGAINVTIRLSRAPVERLPQLGPRMVLPPCLRPHRR